MQHRQHRAVPHRWRELAQPREHVVADEAAPLRLLHAQEAEQALLAAHTAPHEPPIQQLRRHPRRRQQVEPDAQRRALEAICRAALRRAPLRRAPLRRAARRVAIGRRRVARAHHAVQLKDRQREQQRRQRSIRAQLALLHVPPLRQQRAYRATLRQLQPLEQRPHAARLAARRRQQRPQHRARRRRLHVILQLRVGAAHARVQPQAACAAQSAGQLLIQHRQVEQPRATAPRQRRQRVSLPALHGQERPT